MAKFAKDLMTTPITWATPGQTLRSVAKVMIANSVSQLPVRDGEKNIGRITDRMIVEELMKSASLEVATKKIKDLPKYGRSFRVVEPNDLVDNKFVSYLQQDEAILVQAIEKTCNCGCGGANHGAAFDMRLDDFRVDAIRTENGLHPSRSIHCTWII